MPSSEGSVYTFHAPVPTEALTFNSSGTSEPTLVGKVAANPQVVDEVVVTTQFSLNDDDEKSSSGEEDFPTFDKWSMQYLAEQAKQNSEKKQELGVSAGSLLLQKKLRQNYAAASCGAKVVASNPEAENVKYLLNRNPDEYMISPCKAKKWFVVELCEPLQIHKVELGSLEMFSSPPKSFRVFASQRYPTKDWLPVAKFDMVPERSIQSFSTRPSEEFVKFVRVELLEHYGDEHYCPISTFRVMGVDMTSDEEDETVHEIEEADEETFGEAEDEDVEESVSLFTSAKEIVLKLVNKVLYKENQQHEEEGEKAPAADNITVKAAEKQAKSASCSDQGLQFTTEMEMPTAHIPEAGIISPPPEPKEAEEVAIVTKLADTEQLPTVTIETPVVIKLGEEADVRHWDFGVYSTPGCCAHLDWSRFLHMMVYSHTLSTTCPARRDKHLPWSSDQRTPSADEAGEDVGTSEVEAGHEAVVADTTSVSLQLETEDRSAPGIKEVRQIDYGGAASDPVTSSQTGAQVLPTTQLQQKESNESASTSESTSFLSSGVSVTRSEDLEPSSLLNQPDAAAVTLSLMTPDLNLQQSQVVEQGAVNLAQTIFLKVSPSPTLTSEDSMAAEEDMLHEAPTAEHRTDLHVEEHTSKPLSETSLIPDSKAPHESQDLEGAPEQLAGQMLERNETISSGGKTGKSVDLVKVGLSSSSKRDSSIMKLSSRIMALEQNVSMAKRYLEELSRAFKQQNEDMMKLLNKTEKKLNVYMSQSEERELKQKTQTDVLEQQVVNLSQLVDTMQLQMNTLGKELRDAQLLLAFVQAVLFLWLIISSVRGRSQSPLVYTDHQFLLDTMPTKPSFERSDKGSLHRRNSDLGIQSGMQPTMSALKRQVSEANLASLVGHKQVQSVDDMNRFVPSPTQVAKKRKKKKLKQQQLSVDSVSSATSNTGSPPAQSSSFSSCAGVLFGTDSSYRPAPIVHVQELKTAAPSVRVKNSTSQTFSNVHENHNSHSACSLTGCDLRRGHLGCSCQVLDSACLQTGATLFNLRTEETDSCLIAPTQHSISNSCLIAPTQHSISNSCLIAPTQHSISNSCLITPTQHSSPSSSLTAPTFNSSPNSSITAPTHQSGASSALTPATQHSTLVASTPGFHPGVDRTWPNVQSREKQHARDVPGAPQTCEAATVLSQSTSPVFHVPMYCGNKMRTAMEIKSSNHPDSVSASTTGWAGANKVGTRPGSLGFVNSQVGGEAFVTENYMCENHFQFPLSLPLVECENTLKRTAFMSDGTEGVGKHPGLVSCELQQFQSHSWTLPPQSDHYSSASALSCDSTSCAISSCKSLPHTPSFVALHRDASRLPLMLVEHKTHSLSQLPCTSATQPAPAISPHATYETKGHNATTCDVRPLMADLRQLTSKSANTNHTHKRQRSLPLHSLRPSKSSEKMARGRQGSLEDCKLHGNLAAVSLQTSSKNKKISNCSNKNSGGCSEVCVDYCTHWTASKKASI
ncbi:hypothetical protein BsWGS_22959 [Bradybaena similaris]